jgi:dihydroxy-acid dehydratase
MSFLNSSASPAVYYEKIEECKRVAHYIKLLL